MEDWHLRFGITSNCNFRCKYCNSHNSHSKDMSDKDIKEILEAAIENGVKKYIGLAESHYLKLQ